MIPTLEEICTAVNKNQKMVSGCYVFGSQVYGTADRRSDWDIILIANSSSPEVEYNVGNLNIHVIVPDVFMEYVRVNHIKALECLYAPKWAQIKPFDCDFTFKEDSFRHNISHTVSNSWVKCKKKLMQSDYRIGVKSMFHALRIADFGIQFAKTGKIEFGSMNWVWKEIESREWNWLELQNRFQPLRNELLTEFRKLANKEK